MFLLKNLMKDDFASAKMTGSVVVRCFYRGVRLVLRIRIRLFIFYADPDPDPTFHFKADQNPDPTHL